MWVPIRPHTSKLPLVLACSDHAGLARYFAGPTRADDRAGVHLHPDEMTQPETACCALSHRYQRKMRSVPAILPQQQAHSALAKRQLARTAALRTVRVSVRTGV